MDASEPVDPLRRLFSVGLRRATNRYFFDVDDGENSYRDHIDLDLANVGQVPSEAYHLLKQIVYDKWPEGQRTMTVRVRDKDGPSVYVGTMTIDGRRFTP